MFLFNFFLGLLGLLLLSFLIFFIWLMVHLFFSRLPSAQSSSVPKAQITRGILRTLFVFWFSFCGTGLALGFLILKGFAKMNAGMSAVSIPDPSQFQQKVEHWGLALIFMPVFLGIVVSFVTRSKKSVIFLGGIAYILFAAGLLLLAIFDNGSVSLEDAIKGLEASAIVVICFGPVHIGWLGLTHLFPKIQSVAPPVLPKGSTKL